MQNPFFFKKRTFYVPNLPLLLLIAVTTFITAASIFFSIHPFFACNYPLPSDAIIIEGWLPDYCFKKAADIFYSQPAIKKIFITGGPLEKGSYLAEYQSYAELGKASLLKLSLPDSQLIAVPACYSSVNRTYASALAFKEWIDSSGCRISRFTLLSESTHTRRSLLLFRRALGKKYSIGSIAIVSKNYQPRFWWRSSNGVRAVLDETVAYLYALLFHSFAEKK